MKKFLICLSIVCFSDVVWADDILITEATEINEENAVNSDLDKKRFQKCVGVYVGSGLNYCHADDELILDKCYIDTRALGVAGNEAYLSSGAQVAKRRKGEIKASLFVGLSYEVLNNSFVALELGADIGKNKKYKYDNKINVLGAPGEICFSGELNYKGFSPFFRVIAGINIVSLGVKPYIFGGITLNKIDGTVVQADGKNRSSSYSKNVYQTNLGFGLLKQMGAVGIRGNIEFGLKKKCNFDFPVEFSNGSVFRNYFKRENSKTKFSIEVVYNFGMQ